MQQTVQAGRIVLSFSIRSGAWRLPYQIISSFSINFTRLFFSIKRSISKTRDNSIKHSTTLTSKSSTSTSLGFLGFYYSYLNCSTIHVNKLSTSFYKIEVLRLWSDQQWMWRNAEPQVTEGSLATVATQKLITCKGDCSTVNGVVKAAIFRGVNYAKGLARSLIGWIGAFKMPLLNPGSASSATAAVKDFFRGRGQKKSEEHIVTGLWKDDIQRKA